MIYQIRRCSFIVSLLLFSFSSSAQGTTVCSITINSTEEINSFKNIFPEREGFSFIELTDPSFTKPPGQTTYINKIHFRFKNWLKNSCHQLIKNKAHCDIVIISGHYQDTGRFFGSREIFEGHGLYAYQEELENLSCRQTCSSLFQDAKEVYLFGCDTLGSSGKELDNSTVLLDQSSSKTWLRMRILFPNAENIFGFNGPAPLGMIAGPLFEKFLLNRRVSGTNILPVTEQTVLKWLQIMGPHSIVNSGILMTNLIQNIEFYKSYCQDIIKTHP